MIPQKRFWTRKKLNTIPTVWLFVCAILPLCMILVNSFIVGMFDRSVIKLVFSIFDVRNGLITIFNSIFVALISTLLGFYLAFFAIFQRNNLRYILFFVVGFCFVINPIIHYEFFSTFLAKPGVINSFLLHCGLISEPVLINNYWTLLISLVYKFLPISFFLCIPALHNTNTNLIECILDAGASHFYITTHNIISDVKHHLILAFGIIVLLCFGNISIFISHFVKEGYTFSVALNNLLIWTANGQISYSAHITDNIYLSPFILLWIAGIYILNRYFNKHSLKLYLNPFKQLSKYKCVFIGKNLFTTVINLGAIIFYITSVLGLIFYSIKDWNLHLFFDLFDDPTTYICTINQYTVSMLAAMLATMLGTMLAIANSKSTDLRKHYFYKYTILSLTVSEIILIGITIVGNAYIPHSSTLVTVLGLSIPGTLFSSIYMYSSIRKVDKNTENASMDLGANYWQTIKLVTIYTLYPSIVSCFLLIFICLFNEVVITSMFPAMSQKMLDLSTRHSQQMYPLCTLNILFTISILLIANPYNLYGKVRLILKSIVMVLLIITGVALWIMH